MDYSKLASLTKEVDSFNLQLDVNLFEDIGSLILSYAHKAKMDITPIPCHGLHSGVNYLLDYVLSLYMSNAESQIKFIKCVFSLVFLLKS